jgi:hypothetical protein
MLVSPALIRSPWRSMRSTLAIGAAVCSALIAYEVTRFS